MDAVLCAHLAWLWHYRREALQVYGSLEEGYIVAPPPPSHLPRRPAATPLIPTLDADPDSLLERIVSGRPTGYSGGENEKRWKTAIREAFRGSALRAQCLVQVELVFVLAPDQTRRKEPDLDNLIKSTVDALDEVIGVRSGTGSRVEADDVRVSRIVASKRHARAGEEPGATVVVSELPAAPV